MSELYEIGDTEPPVLKKRKRNYVNNPDFLVALRKYKSECDFAISEGKTLPQIPRYIGECIYKISTRIGTRKNFSGYPFIEDMIMDGVETCFKYIDRFDANKYDNPFAFFTRVIWNAFLQRIAKEKKELYIRYINSVHHYNVNVDHINEYIEEYERKMEEKKEKIRQSKLSSSE